MLDTGWGFELVIPARKAVQLRLEAVKCCETKGYGGQCVQMLEFKPIRVTMRLQNPEDPAGETLEKVSCDLFLSCISF